MASEEELYISIDRGIYRGGKSNLLMTQISSLSALKRLYNLKVLARQKNDLRKLFFRLLVSVESDIKAIQGRMPTSSIPKTIKKPEESAPKVKIKKTKSKENDIENELLKIQEKLAQLNS